MNIQVGDLVECAGKEILFGKVISISSGEKPFKIRVFHPISGGYSSSWDFAPEELRRLEYPLSENAQKALLVVFHGLAEAVHDLRNRIKQTKDILGH